MEQDDPVFLHFRPPELVILLRRFVGVQTIDVQHIDRSIVEPVHRFVESHSHHVDIDAREQIVPDLFE